MVMVEKDEEEEEEEGWSLGNTATIGKRRRNRTTRRG